MKIFITILLILIMVVSEGNCICVSKTPNKPLRKLDWWEHTIVYEIIVKSFKDSNGDGTGDLRGLINELDHFVDAGIETIYLTPIYKSPYLDLGYDITDFYQVNEELGTMADLEELIDKVHKKGLRILLDFVPNHASTTSEYFKRSRARKKGYEDYFVWTDPKPDPKNSSNKLLPSNWISSYLQPMWQWDEERKQYYLHQFSFSQADFNLRNPAVRKERIKVMKYWLAKNIDGFRIDAIDYLYEVNPKNFGGTYPDEMPSENRYLNPGDPGYLQTKYTRYLLKDFDLLYEWRDVVDQWKKEHKTDTKIILSESYGDIRRNYGTKYREGAHFQLNADLDNSLSSESSAPDFVYVVLRWLTYIPNGRVPDWVLGNHDRQRMSNQFGRRMVDGINALALILPGVTVNYQGDEIGMRNAKVTLAQSKDEFVRETGELKYSRDPYRTPYQWDSSTSAGFSTNSTTWLPVAQDYKRINLKAQKKARRSHYKFYKSLTSLRKEPALSHGLTHLHALTNKTFVVVRHLETYDAYALVLNVGKSPDEVDLSKERFMKAPMTVYAASVNSTRKAGDAVRVGKIWLQPGEALVLRLPPTNEC